MIAVDVSLINFVVANHHIGEEKNLSTALINTAGTS